MSPCSACGVEVDFVAVLRGGLPFARFGSSFTLSRLVSPFAVCLSVRPAFVRFCPVSVRVLGGCVFVAPSVFSWLAVFGLSFGVFSLVVARLVYLFNAIKKARFAGNFQGVLRSVGFGGDAFGVDRIKKQGASRQACPRSPLVCSWLV